jgi:hypothetical protein
MRILMITAAAVTAVAGSALVAGPAAATPLSTGATLGVLGFPTTLGGEDIVQQASFHRRCRLWRRECAFRWGWGSPRYHRCLRRRGCW